MGILELSSGAAIGMLGAGLAVCLAGAGSARGILETHGTALVHVHRPLRQSTSMGTLVCCVRDSLWLLPRFCG